MEHQPEAIGCATAPLSSAATQPMPTLPAFATPPTPPRDLRRRPRRSLSWCVHLLTLAVLLLVYAAGYSNGRDASLGAAIKAHQNHPAYHPNLKP